VCVLPLIYDDDDDIIIIIIIIRAIKRAQVPAIKEPVSLMLGDN